MLNACGVLPNWWWCSVSYSSLSSPTSLRTLSSRSNTAVACRMRPMPARASESQEAAGQKDPFAAANSVAALFGIVAQQKSAPAQLGLNGIDRADDRRVLGWQKSDPRDQQQRCIQCISAVRLRECVSLGVLAVAADVIMDVVAQTRHLSTGPWSRCCSTARTPRSSPAHAITLEWTKWRRFPRSSHRRLSGSSQWLSRKSSNARCRSRPGLAWTGRLLGQGVVR
jgi:hypothetical protein